MISRRKFITASAATAASVMFLNKQLFAIPTGTKLQNFGFIAGIIGKELKSDWKAILKQAVEFGFTEIETGEYMGDSAAGFNSYCKEIGITPVIGGIKFSTDKTEIKKGIDNLAGININKAVVYWPWNGGGPFMIDDCKRSAEALNIIGGICKENGISFSWHNHNKEFAAMEQGLPFDYLMEHTDKNLVNVELDIYWVKKGGANPVDVLKKYAGRFQVLHIKDMAAGDAQDFECPGGGIIDWPGVFREATSQGIRHFMVERDNVPDGMACLKSSGAFLKSLVF